MNWVKCFASVDVRNVTSVTPPPPAFSSISGAEYLVPGSTGGTATQSSSTTLDIAFIGDDYTAADMTKFHEDVDRMVAQILAVETVQKPCFTDHASLRRQHR